MSEFTTVMWVSRCALAAIAFIAAAYLAYHGKDGWGWMIFAGLLCAPSLAN